jgi:hypothetical protein
MEGFRETVGSSKCRQVMLLADLQDLLLSQLEIHSLEREVLLIFLQVIATLLEEET